MEIENSRQVASLTVGELSHVLDTLLEEREKRRRGSGYAYGLKGIQKLFMVSHCTAQLYRNTFLRPAVRKIGSRLVIDVEEARRLYDQHRSSHAGKA